MPSLVSGEIGSSARSYFCRSCFMWSRINKKVSHEMRKVCLKRLSEYVVHTVSHHPVFLICRLHDLGFLCNIVFSLATERRSSIVNRYALSSIFLRFNSASYKTNIRWKFILFFLHCSLCLDTW